MAMFGGGNVLEKLGVRRVIKRAGQCHGPGWLYASR